MFQTLEPLYVDRRSQARWAEEGPNASVVGSVCVRWSLSLSLRKKVNFEAEDLFDFRHNEDGLGLTVHFSISGTGPLRVGETFPECRRLRLQNLFS